MTGPVTANRSFVLRSQWRPAFALAQALAHPVSDCVYLALAHDLDLPLLTAALVRTPVGATFGAPRPPEPGRQGRPGARAFGSPWRSGSTTSWLRTSPSCGDDGGAASIPVRRRGQNLACAADGARSAPPLATTALRWAVTLPGSECDGQVGDHRHERRYAVVSVSHPHGWLRDDPADRVPKRRGRPGRMTVVQHDDEPASA